jgi:hypothetical protein
MEREEDGEAVTVGRKTKARNNTQATADEIIPRPHKARLFKVQAVAVGAGERRREAARLSVGAEYNKLCTIKKQYPLTYF